MNPDRKKYFWSGTAALVTYVLGFALLYHELHFVTTKQILTVITLPLCAAVFVSAVINLKWVKPQRRKYFWQMTGGMIAYVLGIVLGNQIQMPPSPYKYLLVLLPMLPLIYISFTVIRHITDTDEMWRKIYMEALAFSGLATGFTCFSYLFFRDMGAPEFRAEWAFYMMWAYYGVGLFFSWRRYR